MECRQCASSLDRPGDYCLVCRTANADTAVLELDRDRATITSLLDEDVVGARTITTTPEDADDGESNVVELRNFAGLIADEVRRKRPEEVYVTGDRAVVAAVRSQLHYPFYRVDDENPSNTSSSAGTNPLSKSSRPPSRRSSAARTRRSSAAARASAPSKPSPPTRTSRRSSPAPSTPAGPGPERASGPRPPARTNTATSACSSATAPPSRRTASSRPPATANSANACARTSTTPSGRLTCRSECLPARSTAIGWE